MNTKILLYYFILIFAGTWAVSSLIRASNNLCRGNPYRHPDGGRDHDS